ncbi:MAG TPA: hypothetical protein PKK31_06285 [Elusimicrobiales bacterium]|nr:hypothetical protein [Elusimicrobiales bacterium]
MAKAAFCAALLIMLTISPRNGFALNWGIEVSGAAWEMDAEDFKTSGDSLMDYARTVGNPSSYQITQGTLGGQASVFLEGKSALRFGASLGYGVMPDVSYREHWDDYPYNDSIGNWRNSTSYIPLDAYVKYRAEKSKIGFFAGAGADYIMASTKWNDFDFISGDRVNGTFKQKKLVPHVQGGGELFFSDAVSVSLGVRYLFSAVLDNLRGNVTANGADMGEFQLMMDDDGHGYWIDFLGSKPFKYDYSGLRATAALRVYFN